MALITLPEHIDRSNADRLRERLLLVINRGAAVLIADLAATVSCDYSGADALARSYQRAVASGTELRLVVTAEVVRRVLSLSGLDRLVSIYPSVRAAIAAGAEARESQGEPPTATIPPAGSEPAELARVIADPADDARDLLDWIVNSIFQVAVSWEAAVDLPRDVIVQCINEGLGRLDDVVREIRHHEFADSGQENAPDLAWRPPPDVPERSAQAVRRSILLRQRVARTAHALHSAAADTASLLEDRSDLLDQPGRIDYQTEIKRWRILADQAAQLAEHWEQPQPDSLPKGGLTVVQGGAETPV